MLATFKASKGVAKNPQYDGGSKAVWNFSENSVVQCRLTNIGNTSSTRLDNLIHCTETAM